ncbi:toprim domain-containing protein [Desulfoluna spongiiphila]|uniref:toprim domain-containing protein n=1 Tax=Desulfoluna spongiiphila TaxID=419481 RepID=UPI00125B6C43|nr:toprim domain-containing protein [Desulfoluna spongiiphila]VVS92222.1 toprim-like [Desulfoluna spongiiphila]
MYEGVVPSNRSDEIIQALSQDPRFQFKDQAGYLRYGICPNCGKKELYVSKAKPFRIACGRENKCGQSWTVKELLPHLFGNYEKRYPPSRDNPNATADAYLHEERGFDLHRIRGWYRQYQWKDGDQWISSIRFPLNSDGSVYWERLVRIGKDGRKANFRGKYRGMCWLPPAQVLEEGDRCFITEGIFDAMAFEHIGEKAAASMSSSNFPEQLIRGAEKKRVVWVLALDNDKAGRKAAVKHANRLNGMGQHVAVALTPDGKEDWNDFYKKGLLNETFIDECLYRGRLFMARSPGQKAWHMFQRNQGQRKFVVEFGNGLYRFEVSSDLDTALEGADTPLGGEDGYRLFTQHTTQAQISNAVPELLYIIDDVDMDQFRYVFRIRYKNSERVDIKELTGNALTKAEAFTASLLTTARGVIFKATEAEFQYMLQGWLDPIGGEPDTVTTVPYLGYHAATGAYIFQDHAYYQGKEIPVNEFGYFKIGELGLKSSLRSGVRIQTGQEFNPSWFGDYVTVYHWQGLSCLAWWLGSFFVQQIRKKYRRYPFFELSGEKDTGKSDMLQLLWKCSGRDDYEGFNPRKDNPKAVRRKFNQLSNLPISLLETDYGEGKENGQQQQYNFDSLKDLFNGRGTGAIGLPTKGSDIFEQPFLGALIASQNHRVTGHEATLSRIVHCHMTRAHHRAENKALAEELPARPVNAFSGFMGAALKREQLILSRTYDAFEELSPRFENQGLSNRVAFCHCLVAALGHGLCVLFPDMTEELAERLTEYLLVRAKDRENLLQEEDSLVAQFWKTYEYMNEEIWEKDVMESRAGWLNHSAKKEFIAINLQEFRAACVDYKQPVPQEMQRLQEALKTSLKHPFVKSGNVYSRHKKRSISCFVFQA